MPRSSVEKGKKAEEAAAAFLQRQGWRVLARNVRVPGGEIDLVALDGEVLVFVEVKAHQSQARSWEAIDARKQRRWWQAAALWLARHPEYAAYPCRFDALVLSCGEIEHRRDVLRGVDA